MSLQLYVSISIHMANLMLQDVCRSVPLRCMSLSFCSCMERKKEKNLISSLLCAIMSIPSLQPIV